ncbi:MAG: hypothetical protein GXO75_17730 [Calditrichaeota bacterium]|nr:hypothetical protein [Calditrichota bacterium]
MEVLRKRFIVDENDRKVAVQIDIKTFAKIEEIMENYALFRLMEENESDELMDKETAMHYYSQLDKSS